jgi:hypothetical protein
MTNKPQLNVAIIGAGPYGLSIGAHLRAAQIEHRIFGIPMETWRRHMPPGMYLKSYGESSNLFDAHATYPLQEFAREHQLLYHPTRFPVSLATFIAYGKAFQQRYVPHITRARLIAHRAAAHTHELQFDDGETVFARHVMLAVGCLAFKYIPPILGDLPAELRSHSSAYGPIEHLAGKRVIIVGGGASALDLAALLSLQGTAVTLVARANDLHFQNYPGGRRSALQRIIAPNASGLGAGWLLRACTMPQLVRLLPDWMRSAILSNTLGPSGGYFIRKRVEAAVRLRLGQAIEQVGQQGAQIYLRVVDARGVRTTIVGDHLIAATGYRVDLRQLPFLNRDTLRQVRTIHGAPVLSRHFESSLPGLYFAGLASGLTFGPLMRFVAGATHPARALTLMLRTVRGFTPPLSHAMPEDTPVPNADRAAP